MRAVRNVALAILACGMCQSTFAQSGSGSLKVTSYPTGAEVFVDGVDTGKTTPMSVSLPIGEHVVVVSVPSSGWNDDTRIVTVVSGNNDLSVTLLPTLTVGPQGPAGLPGPAGPMGPVGPQGPKGDTGLQGVQGEKGDTGAQGVQGVKGDKGDTGAQGIQGVKGDKGDKGDAGPQGAQGAVGPTGPQGPAGAQGPVGPAGPAATLPTGTLYAYEARQNFFPLNNRGSGQASDGGIQFWNSGSTFCPAGKVILGGGHEVVRSDGMRLSDAERASITLLDQIITNQNAQGFQSFTSGTGVFTIVYLNPNNIPLSANAFYTCASVAP